MTDRRMVVLVSHPGITHNTLAGVLSTVPCVRVVTAVGALSTFDILTHTTPDTILIDSNLPREETLALLKHIKQGRAQVRCVVLTATARDQHELKAAGADVILFDNCSSSQLEAAVCD